tara:strand:+ start:1713 stop:2177 length:465 start_codon:yes stop_codon:yes gene_type:complete
MKKIGFYTARGILTEEDSPEKIALFDGRFDTGYRVIDFKIWGTNWDADNNPDVIGKLSKNDDGVTAAASFMRADDDNQIAWAVSSGSSDSGHVSFAETIIDPDNMVVEDLYVYARGSQTVSKGINYLVMLEKYEFNDWQGALAMARDRAQGDIS